MSETDGPVSCHSLFEDELTQPSFVVAVVQKIAEIKGLSLDVAKPNPFELSEVYFRFTSLIRVLLNSMEMESAAKFERCTSNLK